MTQDLTAIDFFCGAGGSSTGLVNAGVRVTGAANHWKLAIETHNTNHPQTEHYLDDLQQAHPSWYPRTTIAWFSPECTNHSIAGGRKRPVNQMAFWDDRKIDPGEERSRATMREVVEFTEYHRYEIVIVENVVDVRKWQYYDDWLTAMLNLGYDHKVLYLNAQFFGVPQSRDRFYAVFWKRGNRKPNLEFCPPATCPEHGRVNAVQAWKNPEFQWGRYGQRRQYIYVCPLCSKEIMPDFRPAAEVIDWTIASEKIGDRAKSLKEKTKQRILAGLRKFGHFPHVADLGQSHAAHNGKVKHVDEPLATQTTRQQLALVQPFIASQHGGRDAVRGVDRELPCITTMNNEHGLVLPPYLIILKNSYSKDGSYTLPPRSLNEPLTTVVAVTSQHALITPPLLTSVNYFDDRCVPVDAPLPTQTTANKTALVTPPIIMAYYSNPVYSSVTKPMPTIPTAEHHALITPEEVLPECGFRMLEPHELKLGMSFPDSYVILGNKRNQVRQVGNAVCPPVAELIAHRCVESLL